MGINDFFEKNEKKIYTAIGIALFMMLLFWQYQTKPGWWHTQKQKAAIYMKLAQYDDAIEMYRRVLLANPNDSKARSELGEAYILKEKRFSILRNATNNVIASLFCRSKEGLQSCYKSDAYDRAIYELKKAIELKPSNFEAHYWLAYIYSDQFMCEEAIDEAMRAVELKPKNIEARNLLTVDYALKARVLIVEASNEIFTEDGKLEEAAKQLEMAEIEARRVLMLKPHNAGAKEALNNIANMNQEIEMVKKQKAESYKIMSEKLKGSAEEAERGVYKSSW